MFFFENLVDTFSHAAHHSGFLRTLPLVEKNSWKNRPRGCVILRIQRYANSVDSPNRTGPYTRAATPTIPILLTIAGSIGRHAITTIVGLARGGMRRGSRGGGGGGAAGERGGEAWGEQGGRGGGVLPFHKGKGGGVFVGHVEGECVFLSNDPVCVLK